MVQWNSKAITQPMGIEYGAPIPEEYQSEVLKDYLAEMAADKEVK